MKNRIRAAAIILNKDKVLLVKHVHPKTEEVWWVPPGGGLEEKDSDIFDCAIRETFEETGLKIDVSKIVYLREFLDYEFNALNLEIFLLGGVIGGELTIDNIYGKGRDEHYIKDVQWFSETDMEQITVYPEILTDEFWRDRQFGFPTAKHLGRQIGQKSTEESDELASGEALN